MAYGHCSLSKILLRSGITNAYRQQYKGVLGYWTYSVWSSSAWVLLLPCYPDIVIARVRLPRLRPHPLLAPAMSKPLDDLGCREER